jgi:LmbE family N-acetylglucosaminyl deacetylase
LLKVRHRSAIHLITVFGCSNYLRSTGFENNWQLVSERRRREDAAFAGRIGAHLVNLDFPEAALRLRSPAKVFVDAATIHLPAPRDLMKKVASVFERTRPALILAPLGLGGHRDHLITRNLARTIGRRHDFAVVYYEDLPYAADLSERKLLAHVRSFNSSLQPTLVSIEGELDAKLDNLTLYRSQLGIEEMTAVGEHARRSRAFGPAERFWSIASLAPFNFQSPL